ncbi:MAG: hypothetical protein M1820_010274 [Bogoriella megaspora]|nr:MAG: hypothetical protein M1820_010274 [Bogoriella megaspora]
MEPLAEDIPRIETSELDEHVLSCLPEVEEVLDISYHGASAWARAFRIDTLARDKTEQSYFMKVSVGDHGREALKGEFESTAAIHAITPSFVPKPIAWGAFEKIANTYFYTCKFYNLADDLPDVTHFCANVAALHSSHTSPTGKFGFHVVTYNGDLPQDNTWNSSWEDFFTNGFKHIVQINTERAGASDEMESLLPAFYEKVIPRLLRPLETGGNSIEPSLVHGDLWCGNAAVDQDTDQGIIFDPSSSWAHNEYELGNWRPERNKFSRSYFNAYHTHIPKSSPEEDYDDRNALYAMRYNLHAATLFPQVTAFREMVIEEMGRLIAKYPNGFEE